MLTLFPTIDLEFGTQFANTAFKWGKLPACIFMKARNASWKHTPRTQAGSIRHERKLEAYATNVSWKQQLKLAAYATEIK